MIHKSTPITVKANVEQSSLAKEINLNSSSELTQQFTEIVRRYKYYCKHIQRIDELTDKSYKDINDTHVLTSENIDRMGISNFDREYLNLLKTRPLAFIICSQTYHGKSCFVNNLLNEKLLPESPTIQINDVVRMIRIKVENNSAFGSVLNVFGSYEIIHTDTTHKSTPWTTVPRDELIVNKNSTDNDQEEIESFEIRRPLDILNDDLQIVITPSNQNLNMKQIYAQITENVVPIFIYIIEQGVLSQNDIDELRLFRSIVPNEPILFVRLTQSESSINKMDTSSVGTFRQLCDLGFLSLLSTDSTDDTSQTTALFQSDMIDNDLINFTHFLNYIRKHINRLITRAVNILQKSHEVCLDLFNDCAFDMARDILITPKRLAYAREKEKILYESLIELTNSKQNELQKLILQVINDTQDMLVDRAAALEISGIELTDQLTVQHTRDLKKCINAVEEFVLIQLNEIVANKLLDSIKILHDNYGGTLTRCLYSLEVNKDNDDESELSASKALQEIIHAAYEINIYLPTKSNIFQVLIDRMKELFRTLNWNNSPRIDPDFKRSIALNMLNSLSEIKLAKIVCTQLNDRICMSHENFEALLKQLEDRHSNRLKSTEDRQKRVRKEYTPKIAQLLLESTSLKDAIQYGIPKVGREIGRGQYGVVYECRHWANHESCVIKSVMPGDAQHWKDLALEFYYLRKVPEHPRIVKLIGSVIDYTDSDRIPVLLMMEKFKRDLYTALKHKLQFSVRMRIALDVVEGLRYLHALGLVHRDIKLRNILLDNNNRASISDLGFCKPEVMMSGSLVGTPIHMAPELIKSKYDHRVDIYAFGILFWYICSNDVKLPSNFDICPSKDVLWSAVKNGIRPERLMNFSDECWEIMKECWEDHPAERPYLGEVQEKIERILREPRTS